MDYYQQRDYDRYGFLASAQTGERYIIMDGDEKWGTSDLQQPLKWIDEETGVVVIKSKKGNKYTVKNRYGSSRYDLSGMNRKDRNEWRQRRLAGLNMVADRDSIWEEE